MHVSSQICVWGLILIYYYYIFFLFKEQPLHKSHYFVKFFYWKDCIYIFLCINNRQRVCQTKLICTLSCLPSIVLHEFHNIFFCSNVSMMSNITWIMRFFSQLIIVVVRISTQHWNKFNHSCFLLWLSINAAWRADFIYVLTLPSWSWIQDSG